jgi:fructose-1,6-bisphosphatase I
VKISREVRLAPLRGLLGSSGTENFSGDVQKKLDVLSDCILSSELAATKCVSIVASEESDHAMLLGDLPGNSLGVLYDPLDGSSNIDCAIPTGTIFGVCQIKEGTVPHKELSAIELDQQLLGQCKNLVAAGYVLYSSSTELVLTLGDGVFGFTLDEHDQFRLTRSRIVCPQHGAYYSLNEARSTDWPRGLQQYISDIKAGKGRSGKKFSSRYVCSLVADTHRTLLYGGWAANPRRHLRLLYEAAPLAYIMEQACGKGTDGTRRLLDINPEGLHHRLPVFLGSAEDIDELESYKDVQQIGNHVYSN